MYQKIKTYIYKFYEAEEDISDRYMMAMLSVLILFLITQIIFVSFIEINIGNTIITIVTICLFLGFLALFKIHRYRLLSKVLFVLTAHICVFFFWITSEGLMGAITSTLPIVIFIVVSIIPLKYSSYSLAFTFLFILFLFSIDFYLPKWIVPYESLLAKEIDIITGVLFACLVTAFSFLYLKKQYQSKVEELKNQFESQKKLNEELDNFVYRTSHDLRAPISSTLGLISLIQMTDNLAEIRTYVELQEKSMQKMDSFIIEILNYSRNSRMEILSENVNFQEIYDNSLQQIAHTKSSKKLETALEYDPNYVYLSDKLRLQIIFNNIISNAFRYLDAKKIHSFLTVQISHTQAEIIIEFKDNGLGIPSASIPKIFDMFYRAHKYSQGSGVGLYIVRQSVEKLGGKIYCTSAENIGTTFKVVLPNKRP